MRFVVQTNKLSQHAWHARRIYFYRLGCTNLTVSFRSRYQLLAVVSRTAADLWESWTRPAAVEYCLRGSRSCRRAEETRNWTLCRRASSIAEWAGEIRRPYTTNVHLHCVSDSHQPRVNGLRRIISQQIKLRKHNSNIDEHQATRTVGWKIQFSKKIPKYNLAKSFFSEILQKQMKKKWHVIS